jgi:serine/threonine-protein kinase HipA
VTIRPADGEAWPPDSNKGQKEEERRRKALRFSLAGVQLKFSAVMEAAGGLTIPAQGVGGGWIVKLPSLKFAGVPENEFAMMSLARAMGMDVPEIKLLSVDDIDGLPEGIGEMKGPALAVKRFDRTQAGPVHIEDFAQIFSVYPEDKYKKASSRNLAEVIAAEAGQDDIAEFIRRLVFSVLIGNADMHLKNWSLIYPDRRAARLAPAYDLVSTVPYIADNKAALTLGRSKRMDEFSLDELAYLAGKARLPEKFVLDTARETVARFHHLWRAEGKSRLPKKLIGPIEAHMKTVPIASE